MRPTYRDLVTVVLLQERGRDSEEFGVIPARQRVERKERARLKQVKFSQHQPSIIDPKVSVSSMHDSSVSQTG